MRFETPLAFLLLLFLPLLLNEFLSLSLFVRQRQIAFSAPALLSSMERSRSTRLRLLVKQLLVSLVFIFSVIALARPQTGDAFVEIRASGRDLLLVLDVSGSMEALDFELDQKRVTRLDALKHVTKSFIARRKGDRIGLILFGKHVYTQSPLTLDQKLVSDFVDSLEVGMAGDGTALGDSIAVALQRIESIETNSKVLVLVTDGVRTAGQLNPLEAADLAAKLGVKVYTIGIGGDGPAPFAVRTLFGRQQYQYQDTPLDEKTLKEIARKTNGAYFNATSLEELENVYGLLDELEPREEIRNEYVEYKEQYFWFLATALGLLVAYMILQYFLWTEVP